MGYKKAHEIPTSSQRAADMYALYERGKTLQEIGDLYGLTRERVRQIFAQHSYPSSKLPKYMSVNLSALVERFNAGETLKCLSEEVGVSEDTIYMWLRMHGGKTRGRGRMKIWTQERVAEMYEDYCRGMTQVEVGRKYGFGQNRVSALFKQYGFTR